MDISPYYIDARNALTQPEKMVFVSQYFRRCWMPALGPLGTAIVIYLRGACYYNRKTGERRDSIQLSQREIAVGCGCSVPTIKRELERNDALRRFVQVNPQWERDGVNGRVRQLENHYQIAMDDPLMEVDEARLQEMVQERITQEEQCLQRSGPPRKPIRLKETTTQTEISLTACSKANTPSVFTASHNKVSNAVNTARSNAVKSPIEGTPPLAEESTSQKKAESGDGMTSPVAQIELLRPVAQFESTPIQIELLSMESLLKITEEEQTLNVRETFHAVAKEEEGQHSTQTRQNALEAFNVSECAKVIEELKDWGSERRHWQLVSVCEQYGLLHLPNQALGATRQRLAQETKLGVLKKPGAYYQKVLMKLLANHQVFVPTLAEKDEDDPEAVRRLARQSLGLE